MSGMDDLLARGAKAGALLKAHGETIAVAESATGGLIAAALLAVPGASAYFLGGGAIYTRAARRAFLQLDDEAMRGIRGASEPYARLLADTVRERSGAVWGLSETGAAGPTGNRYGDAAGHSCLAVSGPRARSITLETGSADRVANMVAFAAAALDLLVDAVTAQAR
jgi:PncC family amidohydrolase